MEQILLALRWYKIPLIFAFLSSVCFLVAVVLIVEATRSTSEMVFELKNDATAGATIKKRTIFVDVAGAVLAAGVYELPSDSRVEDAIRSAGGFAPNADEEKVAKSLNRAMRLSDGMKLYIPEFETSHNNIEAEEAIVQINSMSINTASSQQLESLPGVGPTTAAKIIAARPYSDISQLLEKKVVSKSVFEKIKNRLSL